MKRKILDMTQYRSVTETVPTEEALRDWFAGMVMCGDWSHPESIVNDHDKAAKDYYKMADAMMKARERRANGDQENRV